MRRAVSHHKRQDTMFPQHLASECLGNRLLLNQQEGAVIQCQRTKALLQEQAAREEAERARARQRDRRRQAQLVQERDELVARLQSVQEQLNEEEEEVVVQESSEELSVAPGGEGDKDEWEKGEEDEEEEDEWGKEEDDEEEAEADEKLNAALLRLANLKRNENSKLRDVATSWAAKDGFQVDVVKVGPDVYMQLLAPSRATKVYVMSLIDAATLFADDGAFHAHKTRFENPLDPRHSWTDRTTPIRTRSVKKESSGSKRRSAPSPSSKKSRCRTIATPKLAPKQHEEEEQEEENDEYGEDEDMELPRRPRRRSVSARRSRSRKKERASPGVAPSFATRRKKKKQ